MIYLSESFCRNSWYVNTLFIHIDFDPSGLLTFWFSEGQLLRPLVLLFFYFTKITYEREVTQIRNMLKIGERKGSKVYFRELKVESNQLIQRPRLRDEDSSKIDARSFREYWPPRILKTQLTHFGSHLQTQVYVYPDKVHIYNELSHFLLMTLQ